MTRQSLSRLPTIVGDTLDFVQGLLDGVDKVETKLRQNLDRKLAKTLVQIGEQADTATCCHLL
jgi:hypothetical protein